MDLSLSTWMMVAFVIGMILSMWKIYKFLPTRTLVDDDTGEDTHDLLIDILYQILQELEEVPSVNELHTKMTEHKDFDEKKLWRFNPNKLNQLLNKHYLKNEHLHSIKDIHQDIHSSKKL
ncbi:hypothetical protein [Sulfurimonas sp.]